VEGLLAEEKKLVASAKKLGLFAAGAATQKYLQGIQDQQEIMGAIADITMEIYAMESALLRTMKLAGNRGEAAAALPIAMTRLPCTRHGKNRVSVAQDHCRGGRGRHAADAVGDPASSR
jgi:hypothetical protein